MSNDLPFLIHAVSSNCNDFARNGKTIVRQAYAVELHPQVALADKMSGLFCRFQVACKVTSPRKDGMSELVDTASQSADKRVADRDRGGGEVWFVECAVEKCPCRYQVSLSAH